MKSPKCDGRWQDDLRIYIMSRFSTGWLRMRPDISWDYITAQSLHSLWKVPVIFIWAGEWCNDKELSPRRIQKSAGCRDKSESTVTSFRIYAPAEDCLQGRICPTSWPVTWQTDVATTVPVMNVEYHRALLRAQTVVCFSNPCKWLSPIHFLRSHGRQGSPLSWGYWDIICGVRAEALSNDWLSYWRILQLSVMLLLALPPATLYIYNCTACKCFCVRKW